MKQITSMDTANWFIVVNRAHIRENSSLKALNERQIETLLFLIQYQYFYLTKTKLFDAKFIKTATGVKLTNFSDSVKKTLGLDMSTYLSLQKWNEFDDQGLIDELLRSYRKIGEINPTVHIQLTSLDDNLDDYGFDKLFKKLANLEIYANTEIGQEIVLKSYEKNLKTFLSKFEKAISNETDFHVIKSDNDNVVWLVRKGYNDLNDNLITTCYLSSDGLKIDHLDLALSDELEAEGSASYIENKEELVHMTKCFEVLEKFM